MKNLIFILFTNLVFIGLPISSFSQVMEVSGKTYYISADESQMKTINDTELIHGKLSGIIIADDTESPFHLTSMTCHGATATKGEYFINCGTCEGIDQEGHVFIMWWKSEKGQEIWNWGLMGGTGKFKDSKGEGTAWQDAATSDGKFVIGWKVKYEISKK